MRANRAQHTGDSKDCGRPVQTPETVGDSETLGDQYRLQGLGETSADSRDWGRAVQTPDTGGEQCIL